MRYLFGAACAAIATANTIISTADIS